MEPSGLPACTIYKTSVLNSNSLDIPASVFYVKVVKLKG